jgi:hypothetical protein
MSPPSGSIDQETCAATSTVHPLFLILQRKGAEMQRRKGGMGVTEPVGRMSPPSNSIDQETCAATSAVHPLFLILQRKGAEMQSIFIRCGSLLKTWGTEAVRLRAAPTLIPRSCGWGDCHVSNVTYGCCAQARIACASSQSGWRCNATCAQRMASAASPRACANSAQRRAR